MPNESPLTPIIDIGGMTPLMGSPLSPATLQATRWPLLLWHKATGGATTQTRTTNVPPPNLNIIWTERSTAARPALKTLFTLQSNRARRQDDRPDKQALTLCLIFSHRDLASWAQHSVGHLNLLHDFNNFFVVSSDWDFCHYFFEH